MISPAFYLILRYCSHAPSLTCVRLEFDVENLLENELCFPQEGVRIWNTGIISM